MLFHQILAICITKHLFNTMYRLRIGKFAQSGDGSVIDKKGTQGDGSSVFDD